jgi:nogalonic acid methyl ester cyclase / aklanonic acid methyl ester cyclase
MNTQIEIVRRAVAAFNTADVSDVGEYIHPDYENPAVLERSDIRGPESFAGIVKWVCATFADLELLEVKIEEKGSWVRAYLTLYGRHVGELAGMAPTGRRFSGEQLHLFRLADGKIRYHRDWPDFQGTYRQLGEPWPSE